MNYLIAEGMTGYESAAFMFTFMAGMALIIFASNKRK